VWVPNTIADNVPHSKYCVLRTYVAVVDPNVPVNVSGCPAAVQPVVSVSAGTGPVAGNDCVFTLPSGL